MLADQKQGAFNVDNTKELTHISLCAGYGGIDLGLSRTLGPIRTVCFVEIESFAIKNLVSKIEKGLLSTAPIFTDLKKFPWQLFHRKVDILSGGFPCQPFSNAGRKQGDQDPRHLWPYITKGIEQLGRPPIVFFENVSGIISSKLKGNDWTDQEGTPVLLHVLRELERLGYKTTAGTFSAAEVGAPHQRKRVFILGVRNELKQSGVDFINGLIKSNKSNRDTAWPASRGQRPHWYEPPRVTMGNTLHDGPLDSKESRDTNEASDNNTQGQESAIESEGASRPSGYGSLRTSKLGNSDGRNEESHGGEYRLLHSETECREASGLEWTDDVKGLSRQTESSLGRNVDGAADRLDHAELYESCDNRTDELRMLGNGVVPNTATRAFRVLWRELVNSTE